MKPVRQGSILLWPCGHIPDTAIPVEAESGRFIVAHGKSTGHHHSFNETSEVAIFKEPCSSSLYIEAKSNLVLEHEDHYPLTLHKGVYEVIIQRAFSCTQLERITINESL